MQAHKDAALGPLLHTYLRPDTVDQASPQASKIVDQPSAQASATDLPSVRDDICQSARLTTTAAADADAVTLAAAPAAVPSAQHAVAVPEAALAAPHEAAAAATAASGAVQEHAASAAPLEAAAAAMNGTVQAQATAASASARAGLAADAVAGEQAKEEDPSAVSLRLVHSAAKLGLKVRQLSLGRESYNACRGCGPWGKN